MITAPLPRASPSGSGRLSMIIPQNHGLTITYYTSKSGIWLVISRVASYFHEPKASANTAYS